MKIPIKVPDGRVGDFEVMTFAIKEEEACFFNLQQLFSGYGHRAVDPGTYKKLIRRNGNNTGILWMSNTPAEIRDHLEIFYQAERKGGDILINGLGLGVVLTKILTYENIKSITVVEIEKDVIALCGPTYQKDSRVQIIHADALEYMPPKGKKYTCVWHDIWPTISLDNVETMSKLHRKYGRRCDWQGSWGRSYIKRMQREERESRYW